MTDVAVKLSSKEQIEEFVQINTRSGCQVDVRSGRSYIDGKSIMGLLTLKLLKPIYVSLIGDDSNVSEVMQAYKKQHLLVQG
ncbi:hypothetical protein SAMN06296386_10831 [Lachnospiraceae bacterium]|nr:hypothetical protein SAMN06296386_10831 [Lachnospiraceae bacterium]